jgi:hypothetical protein
MQAKLIGFLVTMLLRALTPELLKKFVDIALDFVEDKVLGTASTVDDAIVLPLCKLIRNTFGIPDDDGTYSLLPREIAPQPISTDENPGESVEGDPGESVDTSESTD